MTFTNVFVVLTLFAESAFSSGLNAVSCEFSQDFCGYTPTQPSFAESWIINNGTVRESRVLDGPTSALGDSNGFLQLMQKKGILRSPEIRLSGQICFSLDYFFLGAEVSSLHISATPTFAQPTGFINDRLSNNTLLLFSRNPASSKFDGWQHYEKTVLFRDDTYRITINASALSDLYKNIALDNLKFTNGPCPNVEGDKVCDFDSVEYSGNTSSPHCDWITIRNSDNATEDAGMKVAIDDDRLGFGTDGDHSTASRFGGFLYVNGSRNQATIETKTFHPGDGRHCLSFYTCSYGSPRHMFQVFEKALKSGSENLLFEQTPDSPYFIGWVKKSIDIDPVVDLNIQIRVTTGNFMLDSLKLSKGKCNPHFCDFSKDLCSWNVDNMWKPKRVYIGRGRIQEPSRVTEINDLDYPNRYLYADFTGDDGEYHKQLWSVVFTSGGNYCFKYVYKKENYPHGTQLWLQFDGVSPDYLPPQRDGNWSIGLVNLKATRNFGIQIYIYRHWRDGTDVKIVKIRETALLDGLCGQQPVTPRFGEVNFHCHQTGHFIPQYRSCDGVIDCPMGEDEDERCDNGQSCVNGGIPCRRRGHNFCLTDTEKFCNGVKDCDDASDEDPRMCQAETFCENYCLNGECRFSSYSCECSLGTNGKRCT